MIYRKRCIGFIPENRYFHPRNAFSEEVVLTIDEVEALRLSDFNGNYQEESANNMDVSRQTFQRIIKEARFKVAKAIIEGHAIKIEGGEEDMFFRRFDGIGRGQGGPGRGIYANTTGRCRINPDMPMGYRRNFADFDLTKDEYAKALKKEYERVIKDLEKDPE